jgi:hypothetical protein
MEYILILQTMGAMLSGNLLISRNWRKKNGFIYLFYLFTIIIELGLQGDINKSSYDVSKLKSPTPSFFFILPVSKKKSFK